MEVVYTSRRERFGDVRFETFIKSFAGGVVLAIELVLAPILPLYGFKTPEVLPRVLDIRKDIVKVLVCME